MLMIRQILSDICRGIDNYHVATLYLSVSSIILNVYRKDDTPVARLMMKVKTVGGILVKGTFRYPISLDDKPMKR